ncbi:hypothetical protein [Cupriavidus plantarum]|uniref:hypothetical protein n=1 Tax=Cupriavidus plantarum TaxID=942865 RepID=UPI000E2291C0|nr:hypothetical protein [Cupriavidus plantarum]REE93338.1 hypothetical protein C7418_2102 [Cupriavidus plantarum]
MRIVNGYVQSMDPSDVPGSHDAHGAGAHGHKTRGPAQRAAQPKRPQNLRAARSARARAGVQHDPEGIESGHTAHEESELTELHHIDGHHPRTARRNARRRSAASASHDPEQEGDDQDDAIDMHEHDAREDWRQRLVIQSSEQRGGEGGFDDRSGGHGDEERFHDPKHDRPQDQNREQRAPGFGNAFRQTAARRLTKHPAAGQAGLRDADIGWAQSVLLAQIPAIQQPVHSGAARVAGQLERQTRETMLRYLAQRVRRGRATETADPAMAPGKLETVRAQLVAERERLREQGIAPRASVLLDEAQQRQFLLLPLKLLMLSSPGPRRHGNQAVATIQSLLGHHRRRP